MGLRPWAIGASGLCDTLTSDYRVQCTEWNGTNGGCVAWLVSIYGNRSQTMDLVDLRNGLQMSL